MGWCIRLATSGGRRRYRPSSGGTHICSATIDRVYRSDTNLPNAGTSRLRNIRQGRKGRDKLCPLLIFRHCRVVRGVYSGQDSCTRGSAKTLCSCGLVELAPSPSCPRHTLARKKNALRSTDCILSHCHQPLLQSTIQEDQEMAQQVTALRLRPLLPGITSSLTRLATSRLKTRPDGVKHKATPSSVVAAAIELLGDLLRATLSDDCLRDATAHLSAFSHPNRGADTAAHQVMDLEDFAELSSEAEAAEQDPEEEDLPLSLLAQQRRMQRAKKLNGHYQHWHRSIWR